MPRQLVLAASLLACSPEAEPRSPDLAPPSHDCTLLGCSDGASVRLRIPTSLIGLSTTRMRVCLNGTCGIGSLPPTNFDCRFAGPPAIWFCGLSGRDVILEIHNSAWRDGDRYSVRIYDEGGMVKEVAEVETQVS